jgi:hypothetical protein
MGRPNLGQAHSNRPEKVQHHYVEAIGGSVALPAEGDTAKAAGSRRLNYGPNRLETVKEC